jgi:hypothetical protein
MNEAEARQILAQWMQVPEDDIALEGRELVAYVQFGLANGKVENNG